jgi:hypothetical protein
MKMSGVMQTVLSVSLILLLDDIQDGRVSFDQTNIDRKLSD